MIKNFFDKIQIKYIENASLKNYNTYRINASCSYIVFPKDEQQLIEVVKELKKEHIKYVLLGNGSNVILAMNHYEGVIIKLDSLNEIKYNGNIVTAGAGCPLIKLASDTIAKGLSGLEFATAIPGCVGACTAMNAGAYNSDMASVVIETRCLNDKCEIVNLTNKELNYTYRDSFLKQHKE